MRDLAALTDAMTATLTALLAPIVERLVVAETRVAALGDLRDRVVVAETKAGAPDRLLDDMRGRLGTLETRAVGPSATDLLVADLRDRIVGLETRTGLPVDLGELPTRLLALETWATEWSNDPATADTLAATAATVNALATRVNAVEGRPLVEEDARDRLRARVAALEARATEPPTPTIAVPDLALVARIEALEASDERAHAGLVELEAAHDARLSTARTLIDGLSGGLAAVEATLAAVEARPVPVVPDVPADLADRLHALDLGLAGTRAAHAALLDDVRHRLDGLEGLVPDTSDRLVALEARPVVAPDEVAAVADRVTRAIDARVETVTAEITDATTAAIAVIRGAVDHIAERLHDLDGVSARSAAALDLRVAAVEARPVPAPIPPPDPRLDTLSEALARLTELEARHAALCAVEVDVTRAVDRVGALELDVTRTRDAFPVAVSGHVVTLMADALAPIRADVERMRDALAAVPAAPVDDPPEELAAHFAGLLTHEMAALAAAMPAVKLQKRVQRDASGGYVITDEPVA